MRVLNGGRFVPAFNFGQPLFLNRLCDVPQMDLAVTADIVGKAVMDKRRAIFHGLLGIKYEREDLIVHFNQSQGAVAGDFIFGDHGGHIVAVIADMAV